MAHKVIVPIGGVDESMVGFSLNGWEIKKLSSASKECSIIDDITDADLYQRIHKALEIEDVFAIIQFVSNRKNPFELLMVKEMEVDNIEDLKWIVDVFRVFKASSFGCWYPIILKPEYDLQCFAEGFKEHMTNFLQIRPLLSLSAEEREQITLALQKWKNEQFSPVVKTMLAFFHDSCRQYNRYLSFVTRVTILEMLIDGNAELSYRLRRNVAVLLGRSKEESIEIANHMKAIYAVRSKFLHDGGFDTLTDELMEWAYEYSRRVIINLLYISDDLSTIRSTLERAGYGENPYNVIFKESRK